MKRSLISHFSPFWSRWAFLFLLILSSPLGGWGAVSITASIMIADEGDVLYSCAGHCFLRMQCPEHNLDYCYSYESEDVEAKVLTFLAGDLKMGMGAIPTEEYLQQYKEEGRGVKQYDLNLPLEVKQNLWRVLDEHVAEGMDLPYDYLERGCAISVLHVVEEALGTESIDYGQCDGSINDKSRREMLSARLDNAPWVKMMINVLCNGSANDETTYSEKLVTPQDLAEQLQKAKAYGHPLLNSPVEVVKPTLHNEPTWFTPILLAVILLVLTLVCVFFNKPYMTYVLLALQTIVGLVNVYLVVFSSLCGTEWSWLLIPFNPLPLLLWHWRKKWMVAYGAILVVWALCMMFAPHSLTHPCFIILTVAIAADYMKERFNHFIQYIINKLIKN